MKKSLPLFKIQWSLSLMFLLPVTILAQAPIVNGGFESWSAPVLFQRPSDWFTDVNPASAPLSTMRSTDTNTGNGDYSLRLTTVEDQGSFPNPVPVGYAVLGEFIYEFPPKGIPWNRLVDEFKIDLKYDIKPGDAGVVWVRMTKDGEAIVNKLQPITGSQSSWTTLTLDLFAGAATAADSIMIGIASSIPKELNFPIYTPKTGSWVMVDNLRFSYNGTSYQVPNYSFENWEDFSIEEPDNWTSSNTMLTYDETTNVVKTTDSHSGTYGAQLTTVPTILSNTPVPGVLSYGDALWTDGGVPYTDKPLFLTGAYKYAPSGSDAGYIQVYFTSGNTIITNSQLDITSAGSDGNFVLPINFPTGSSPEKVFINIFSGNNVGSELKVDDIQLTNGSTGIGEVEKNDQFSVYPNPFSDLINLKNAKDINRVTFSSLSGQVVLEILTRGSQSTINTSTLLPGQYLITIETQDGKRVSEVVIKDGQ